MRTFSTIALLLSAPALAQHWTCGKGGADSIGLPSSRAATSSAGFDFTASPVVKDGACVGPFFFSAPLAEGNYVVTVEFGGRSQSETTVKAEGRRLMLPRIGAGRGRSRTESFAVNIRTPHIARTGEEVKRKPRELDSLRWDSRLTLEFAGADAAVRSITIRPAPPNTVTVYLAGDSTVVDQDKEPWAAWGQMLPAFFTSSVAIANHAESGETIRSSTSELRFEKIFSTIQPGDYLFMQFAHNDQKPGAGHVSIEEYAELTRRYIMMARQHGATPVLVTSMNRRTFDSTGHIKDTLAPYPETVRKIAAEEDVPLIDLNSMSKKLYEAIGEARSRKLFVYAAPNTYPGQTEALHDDTHFNSYGAYELARCVVLGIGDAVPGLATHLRGPAMRFDLSHPDDPASVFIPPTPFVDSAKPYER